MNDPFSASSLVSDSYSEVNSDEEGSQTDLAIKTPSRSSSPIRKLQNKQPQSNKSIKSDQTVTPPSKTDLIDQQTNQEKQGAIPKSTSKNDTNSELFKKVAKNAFKGKPKPPIFEDITTRNKFDSLTDEQEPPSKESKQSGNSAGKKIKETSTNNKLHTGKSSDLFTPSYMDRKRKHEEASGSNTNLDISSAKKPNTYNIPVIGSTSGYKPSDVTKPTKPSAQWR